jgi:hypothetical protein
MTLRAASALLALAALAACAVPPDRLHDGEPAGAGQSGSTTSGHRGVYQGGPPSFAAPSTVEASGQGEELALVTRILREIQLRSFAENRELCGYIGLSPSGEWVATPIMAGSEASCPLPPIPADIRLAASFHTHSTYSPEYASEWPTTQDMLMDAETGIDGYIATPGGRLWHVDTDTMTVRQVCGRGCLPQDPNYVADDDGPLAAVMSYQRISAWERTPGPY